MSNKDDKKIYRDSLEHLEYERRDDGIFKKAPLRENFNYTISQANVDVKKPNIVKKDKNND